MYYRGQMKKSIIAIALAVLLLTGALAACSGSGADTPAQSTPESSAPASAPPSPTNPAPAPPPAAPAATPDPEPEVTEKPMPAMWRQSEVFEYSDMQFKINADWIREDTGEATIFHFFGDSDIPKMSVYSDYVTGYADDDFESFADWWLKERFKNPAFNPGVTVTREEFVTYDFCKGLELEYSDANGNDRHTFITLYQSYFIQLSFTFDPDTREQYRDDVEYVLESILVTRLELNEWPSAALPKGTPVYPGNDMEARISRDINYTSINISVMNSSLDNLLSYIESLSDSGWDITDRDSIDGGNYRGSKGDWRVTCQMVGGDKTILSVRFEYNER